MPGHILSIRKFLRESYFREKRHICGVKNSQLGHDVPISVNDRVFSPRILFSRNLAYVKFDKALLKISEFTVIEGFTHIICSFIWRGARCQHGTLIKLSS